MKPFDLKKALEGAPVVSGSGLRATRIFPCDDKVEVCFEDGTTVYYEKDGWHTNRDWMLFMDDPKPDAMWMQMFCAFVGQEWSDEMEFEEICQVVDKAYAAVDKHFAGKSELG